MSWRGLTIAAAAHLLVLAAALGFIRLNLPQPAPQGSPISLVMDQAAAPGEPTPAASQAQPQAVATPARQTPPERSSPPMPSLTNPDSSRAVLAPRQLASRPPATASLARVQGSHTSEKAMQASDGITRPAKALSKLNVYYSLYSQVGQQGQVGLEIWVLPDGLPSNVIIIRSSGYIALDNVARNAVLGLRFQPAMKNGIAVASVLPYVFRFEMQQ